MEANNFVLKLKASGNDTDFVDLALAHKNYSDILNKLKPKDKGTFALNILCTLCRNLEKVPKWSQKVSNSLLLKFAIECVKETTELGTSQKVQTLACIYHLHKHAIKQKPIPETMILSYIPFDVPQEDLLAPYRKTYWNIIVDRITYLEVLKNNKINIQKYLQKLTEDVEKCVSIYDSIQFFNNLSFLVKKLYFLYNGSEDLSVSFVNIYEKLAAGFCKENIKLNMYEDLLKKVCECLYVAVEYDSNMNFKNNTVFLITKICLEMLKENEEIRFFLENIYLSSFCMVLVENQSETNIEICITNLLNTINLAKKLKYEKTLQIILPYLNQFLRFYIDYSTTKNSLKYFTKDAKLNNLKLIYNLMNELKTCKQIVKCENCNLNSALHDSLRISFTVKSFIQNQSSDLNELLPEYLNIIKLQVLILERIHKKCTNHEKYLRKIQTDIHNTAILLNKYTYMNISTELLDIYLNVEITYSIDNKNISRGFFNKSICELDAKLYEKSLINAYMSLAYAYPDINTDKYISLVIDIKSKMLKENIDDYQSFSTYDACKRYLLDVKPNLSIKVIEYLKKIKFSDLLNHEFKYYSQLWPSILPVAGVWKSMLTLIQGITEDWLLGENKSLLKDVLINIIFETLSSVRSIQNEDFKLIIKYLLNDVESVKKKTPENCILNATLMLLSSEYSIYEATEKYGWKTCNIIDPDNYPSNRTAFQEHEVLKQTVKAVDILYFVAQHIKKLKQSNLLNNSLKIIDVYSHLLFYYNRCVEGLQLAFICCDMSKHFGLREIFIRNMILIMSFTNQCNKRIEELTKTANLYVKELFCDENMNLVLLYYCEAAIFSYKNGNKVEAIKLLRLVQYHLLKVNEKGVDVNLDLSTGRFLEACREMSDNMGPTLLTQVLIIQKHYLTLCNGETKYLARQIKSLQTKLAIARTSLFSTYVCSSLLLNRRARSCAGLALNSVTGYTQAVLYCDVIVPQKVDDAQIKIDNRLKNYLGLQPSNETQPLSATLKPILDLPTSNIEIMLESQKTRDPPSPVSLKIEKCKLPSFLQHKDCNCHVCCNPYNLILFLKVLTIQASVFYRLKEFTVAKNYFDCCFKVFTTIEVKLSKFKLNYESTVLSVLKENLCLYLSEVYLELLLEVTYFELSQSNNDVVDSYIVRIHEVMQGNIIKNILLTNSINYLLTVAAKKRQETKRTIDNLEIELENLKLSPQPKVVAVTPENKPKVPPKSIPVIVSEFELPQKNRKVIKLNLDDVEEPKSVQRPKRNTKSTIPVATSSKSVPKVSVTKPKLELITPRTTRKARTLVKDK